MLKNVVATLALIMGISLLGTSGEAAEEQDGGAPGDWLARYTASRALGLGGAFVAAADEPLGVVWNPAGLSLLYQNEAHFETARLYESTSIYGVSFAVPSRSLPSFAVSILSLNSGDFERTNELNEPLGTFAQSDLAVFLSAAKSLSPRLSLGANVKIVRQSVEEFGATGVGGDLGFLYDVTPTVRVGAAFMNLGGPHLTLRDTEETYSGHFRAGAATRVFGGKGMVSAEIDHSDVRGVSIHAGTEYWLYPQVAVRMGYNDNAAAGGVTYRFPSGLQVNYGLSDQELGITHRLGVSYRFGGFFASSEADPAVFSPLGEQSVTKIHLKAKTKAETEDWSLEIQDKSNRPVRRFGGRGTPPAHLMWDGKDEAGLPLADGIYTCILTVRDQEGRVIAGRERTVEITTGGPQGTVPVAIN